LVEKARVSGALEVGYFEALVDLLFEEGGVVDGRDLGKDRGKE
jgi:hypothetical protein